MASALLAGSVWFWGARLLAGALLLSGVGATPAQLLSWVGVAGAGWVFFDRSRLVGGWGRVALASLLVVLPEALAIVAGRAVRSASTGLRIDATALAVDVAARVLPSAAALVAATGAWWLLAFATSGARRSPT
jgi:hypothetical protein